MPLDTELHKAANKGDSRSVKELVESGEIGVNEPGAQNRTAIHRAAGANHVSIIQYLLQAGAPVDCVDRCLRTPLHWAAISGHLDATQAKMCNRSCKAERYATFPANFPETSMVNHLFGTQWSRVLKKFTETCNIPQKHKAWLLLENGADLRLQTVSGMNPLMCAVQQGWPEVIKAIVDWAATPSEGGNADATTAAELCAATDADGKTALMFAKENGDKLTVKRLKLYEPKRKPGICCGSGGGRSRNRQQALTAVIPQQQPSFGRDREERLSGGQVGEELGGEAVKKAAESTEAGQKPAGGWCCLPFGRRRGQLPPSSRQRVSSATKEACGDEPPSTSGSAVAPTESHGLRDAGDKSIGTRGGSGVEDGSGGSKSRGTSADRTYDGLIGVGAGGGRMSMAGNGHVAGQRLEDGLNGNGTCANGIVASGSVVDAGSAYSDFVVSDALDGGGRGTGSEGGLSAPELPSQQVSQQQDAGAKIGDGNAEILGMEVGEELTANAGDRGSRGESPLRKSRSSSSNHRHGHRSKVSGAGDGARRSRRRRLTGGEPDTSIEEGGASSGGERRHRKSRDSTDRRDVARWRGSRPSRDRRHRRSHSDRETGRDAQRGDGIGVRSRQHSHRIPNKPDSDTPGGRGVDDVGRALSCQGGSQEGSTAVDEQGAIDAPDARTVAGTGNADRREQTNADASAAAAAAANLDHGNAQEEPSTPLRSEVTPAFMASELAPAFMAFLPSGSPTVSASIGDDAVRADGVGYTVGGGGGGGASTGDVAAQHLHYDKSWAAYSAAAMPLEARQYCRAEGTLAYS